MSADETLIQLGDAIGSILVMLVGPSRPGGIVGIRNWAVARRAEQRECLRLGQAWNTFDAHTTTVIELYLDWRLGRQDHYLLVDVAKGIAQWIVLLTEREFEVPR